LLTRQEFADRLNAPRIELVGSDMPGGRASVVAPPLNLDLAQVTEAPSAKVAKTWLQGSLGGRGTFARNAEKNLNALDSRLKLTIDPPPQPETALGGNSEVFNSARPKPEPLTLYRIQPAPVENNVPTGVLDANGNEVTRSVTTYPKGEPPLVVEPRQINARETPWYREAQEKAHRGLGLYLGDAPKNLGDATDAAGRFGPAAAETVGMMWNFIQHPSWSTAVKSFAIPATEWGMSKAMTSPSVVNYLTKGTTAVDQMNRSAALAATRGMSKAARKNKE
jgi:hypothetical protein